MQKPIFTTAAAAIALAAVTGAPAQARFLQTDPVGYEDQQNLYAYVFNDPINNTDPTGEETVCADDGSTCITVVTQQQTSGNAVTAPNGPASGATVLGNNNLDVAASEVAGELDQQRGNERVYRADETAMLGVPIVVSTEVPTTSAGPSSAAFDGNDVAGADGVFHTEPERLNNGIPGDGDIEIPDRLGVPNYALYGENATAIELNNGTVQIRPVNHRGNRRELRGAARRMQRRIRP